MTHSLITARRILLAGALACASPAFATITVYTDRAAFDAATIGSIQTEYGFPEFSGIGQQSLGVTYVSGPVTFTSADGGLLAANDFYYPAPYLASFLSDSLIVSTSAIGLGLYLGDVYGPETISYTVDGISGTYDSLSAPDTTFIGFTTDSDPISVTFSAFTELDVLRFVAITPAAAVPEPASWAMMIGGFALAGLALRQRRTKIAPIFA